MARHLSEDLRDAPLLGSEQLLYWTEHVVRHGGSAHHIARRTASSPTSGGELFRLYHLDLALLLFATLLAAGFVLIGAAYYALNIIVRMYLFAERSPDGGRPREKKSEGINKSTEAVKDRASQAKKCDDKVD